MLLERGDAVTVLARSPAKAQALAGRGATVVAGDLMNPPSELARGMRGADVVFHLAAIYEIGHADPAQVAAVNVQGTRSVLQAAREADVAMVVHVSSVAALGHTQPGEIADEEHLTTYAGDFGSPYERTKHESHLVAEEAAAAGQDVRIACPGGVYGPGDTSMMGLMFRLWVRRLLPLVPFADSVFSWVHVDDVCDGLVRVAERGQPGRTYITGGEIGSIRHLLTVAGEVAGRRPPLGTLPTGVLRASRTIAPRVLPRLGLPRDMVDEGIATMADRGWA